MTLEFAKSEAKRRANVLGKTYDIVRRQESDDVQCHMTILRGMVSSVGFTTFDTIGPDTSPQ